MNNDPIIGTLTFSQIQALSDDDKEAYLDGVLAAESERVICASSQRNLLTMRALQAKCDGIRRRVKSPLFAARMMSDLMHRKLDKLRQAFNGATK